MSTIKMSQEINHTRPTVRARVRRRVRTAELDFGLSCTECTESDGRTSRQAEQAVA